MLRTTINSLGSSFRASTYNVSNTSVSVQSVRWAPRKPMHLGTAKSKLFKVPPRLKEDPEERAELMRLNKTYKTYMRSLMAYFKEETDMKESLSADRITTPPEAEVADVKRRLALNDAWNAECAKLRAARLAKEDIRNREFVMKRLLEKEERDAERLELAENMVRFEKEQSSTYIKREKINEAIEDALATETDFNFAIDLKGTIHYGRTSEIPKPDKPALGEKSSPQLAAGRN